MLPRLAAGIAALTISTGFLYAQSANEETPKMIDLESVEALKAQFNADAGKRRLLLLLSPT